MEKLLERFRQFNTREKILLIVAIIVLLYIGLDKALISPFLESIHETKDRLETQEKLLKKYYSFLENKGLYHDNLQKLEGYYKELKGKFLHEETEELASAKLQELINQLATKNDIVVSRSTALQKEVLNKNPYLIALSINFEVKRLDSTEKLQNFLYDIEYNTDKLLILDNLRIKALSVRAAEGTTISSSLTAIAYIGKKS